MKNRQKELDRLNKRIEDNTKKLRALEALNARLEPLREKFGDRPESELLALASQEVA